jgi:hypothetical protein
MNTLLKRLHTANKGQAMAEFCVAAPLLILLWWSIWCLSEMYTTKNKTLVAARYGSWLLSRYDNLPGNEITPDQVRRIIADRFFDGAADGLSVEVEHTNGAAIDDIAGNADAGLYNDEIIDYMEEQLALDKRPSTHGLKVVHAFPNVFGAVDLRDLRTGPFMIQSRHFVDGNSWDGGRIGLHDVFGIVEGMIEGIIDPLAPALEEYEEGVNDCEP